MKFEVKQFDFWGREHPVSPLQEGDRIFIYDADERAKFNGLEGEIHRIMVAGEGWLYYALLDGYTRTESFWLREIKKVRGIG